MFWKKKKEVTEESFDAKMKEVTHQHEVNEVDFIFNDGVTEVDTSVGTFDLNPAAQAKRYQGNKQFLLRVIVDKTISTQDLRNLTQHMVDKYFEGRAKYQLYYMTFKVPGQCTYSRDTVTPGKTEIRLYCKFHEDENNSLDKS